MSTPAAALGFTVTAHADAANSTLHSGDAIALDTRWQPDAPPRFIAIEYTLHLVTPEPAHRVELLHRNLQKFGTVYNTLAAVCEVSGTVTTSG